MNAEPRKTAAELRQELEQTRRIVAGLDDTERTLEERLFRLKVRKREITGIINKLEYKIEQADRWEADLNKPTIVWKVKRSWGLGTEENEYVFVKKTAKRIYIRRRGEEQEKFYNLDGTSNSKYDGVIDVEASGLA